MPGATPTQGFVYPLPSEAPTSWAATWAALAGQLDARAALFDTDATRLGTGPGAAFVKVSQYPVPPGTFNGSFGFNVVEFNRNTPTDLATYNGIILNSGFWLLFAELVGAVPASSDLQLFDGFKFTPAPDVAAQNPVSARTWNLTGSGLSTATGNDVFQGASVADFALISTAATKVTLNTSFAPAGLSYICMGAVQVGDF